MKFVEHSMCMGLQLINTMTVRRAALSSTGA